MANSVQSIALDKLIAHPDNPNKMSSSNFTKLVRNIEQTGRYEPIVVRPHPTKRDCFQIINGHHRCRALAELGCKEADAIVWDIDDEQAEILLATLNRLGGSDESDKKLALLRRLNKRTAATELAKLLPQTAKQIERLVNLKMPSAPAKINAESFAIPLVFFVNDAQQQIVEKALSLAAQNNEEKTKAAKNAAALVHIAQYFIKTSN